MKKFLFWLALRIPVLRYWVLLWSKKHLTLVPAMNEEEVRGFSNTNTRTWLPAKTAFERMRKTIPRFTTSNKWLRDFFMNHQDRIPWMIRIGEEDVKVKCIFFLRTELDRYTARRYAGSVRKYGAGMYKGMTWIEERYRYVSVEDEYVWAIRRHISVSFLRGDKEMIISDKSDIHGCLCCTGTVFAFV